MPAMARRRPDPQALFARSCGASVDGSARPGCCWRCSAWLPIVLAMIAWSTWLNGSATRRHAAARPCRTPDGRAALVRRAPRHAAALVLHVRDVRSRSSRHKAPHYIHRYELKNGLLQILRRGVPVARADADPEQDRVPEALRRRPTSAPCPTSPSSKQASCRSEQPGTRDSCLAQDLFVKPTRGRGGEGAGLWRWTGRGLSTAGWRAAVAAGAAGSICAELSKSTHAAGAAARAQPCRASRDLSNGALVHRAHRHHAHRERRP